MMTAILRTLLLCAAFVPGLLAAAEATGPDERFDVFEFRVLGSSVLPPIEVERAVYPHLGPERTLADVERARQDLENAYRAAGYATAYVDIPEQDVNAGIVRLRVTEGRLDRVRVSGARYYSGRKILTELPSARSGEVPRLPLLQEELAQLNRQSADLRVTPILKAGRAPGTVDLDLSVQDQPPVHASVEVNDRYTPDTSRLRVTGNLGYTNLFQAGHSFGLQYQTAPQEREEVRVLAASYAVPVGDRGGSFMLNAIRSDTDVAALGTLGVLGRGTIAGARMLWALPAGGWAGSLSFGADYKNVEELIRTEESEDGIARPIEYLAWSLQHNAARRGGRHSLSTSLSANFGMRELFNEPDEFWLKRYRAGPNFFYLRGGAQLEHALGKGFSIAARMSGQYSVAPLISNEQFSIGGVDTVRGYTEADEFGDYGLAGGLELRSPRWRPTQHFAFQVVAFADAGLVELQNPLPGQDPDADLWSVGLGARLWGLDHVEAWTDWAYAMRDSSRTAEGDSRVHFSLKFAF